MLKPLDILTFGGIVLAATLLGRGAYVGGVKNKFREGLRVKVEEVADNNKDGHLSIEEMVAVCNTLKIDPSERLYKGFYLSLEESKDYLKAQGKFNPETDTAYNIGRPTANFYKAIAEGKYVYTPKF